MFLIFIYYLKFIFRHNQQNFIYNREEYDDKDIWDGLPSKIGEKCLVFVFIIFVKLKTSFIFKEIWIDSKDNEVVRGYDGMVYIADLKSVPFEGCGFESHYPHLGITQ